MIEKYLESSIESKCQLIVLFFKTSYLSITEAAEKTGLTFLQLNHYCEELNAFFPGSLSMTIQKRMISCQFTHPFKETYLYQLYASSNVLQLLAFLIKNGSHSRPLTDFARSHFLSNSSAYRMREALVPLLRNFELKLSKNKIVGEEYRIRYLIALLYSKFGIKVYDLTQQDKNTIHSFLSHSSTHLKTSPWLSESFSFYDILLALSWKRHQFSVTIPQTRIFQQLKKLFVYDSLKKSSRDIIETYCQLNFSAGDLDYLYLIYITANNSFASLQWTPEHIRQCCQLFEENDTFRLLLNPIITLLPNLKEQKASLVKALMFFSKSFLFNLQHFIPETNLFISPYYKKGNQKLYTSLKLIVEEWMAKLPGKRYLNHKHFHLFCHYVEQILRNIQPPLVVVFVASNFINAHLLTDSLPRYFSDKSINFHSYYLLQDNVYQIPDLKPDLVITHSQLIPFVQHELTKGIAVAEISFDESILSIQELIYQVKEEKFQADLTKQLT
ncbi:transcriptional regulator RofA [Streptococcus pyogenes]